MLPPRLEHERPAEWLRWLAETPDGYQQLLQQAGGMARAAYRIASARCRVQGGLGEMPTVRELQAAALMPPPPSSRRSSVPSLRRAS
jgi:hypothetical protein